MELDGSVRLFRRGQVADPYNPARTVQGGWSDSVKSRLDGAVILRSPGVSVTADDRVGAAASVTLYVEAGADIRKGDGVSENLSASMPDFVVEVVPVVNRNPFTGWAPPVEVPLVERVG